jgi:hypothetical protein
VHEAQKTTAHAKSLLMKITIAVMSSTASSWVDITEVLSDRTSPQLAHAYTRQVACTAIRRSTAALVLSPLHSISETRLRIAGRMPAHRCVVIRAPTHAIAEKLNHKDDRQECHRYRRWGSPPSATPHRRTAGRSYTVHTCCGSSNCATMLMAS